MKIKLAGLSIIAALLAGAAYYFLQTPPAWTVYQLPHAENQIEVFEMQPTLGRPWPVVILLHGDQTKKTGGEFFAKNGTLQTLVDAGFIAVAVSQPGYGASTGRADFAGPIAQKAVHAVIAELRSRSEVRFDKIAVVGIGRGAVLAANVAAGDAMLAAVVTVDGVLNFRKTIPRWQTGDEVRRSLAAQFEQEAGLSKQAYRERSLAMQARPLKVPILSFDGVEDEDRRYLFRRMRQRNVEARGLALTSEVINSDVMDFLKSMLR